MIPAKAAIVQNHIMIISPKNDKITSVNAGTLQLVYHSPEKVAAGAPKKELWPQGLLMRVWPDFVHFERRDFKNLCRFDPAWECPVS